MSVKTANDFTATLGNGLFNVKYVGDGIFELWVGTFTNPKPYVFGLSANDLEVFANNLLQIVKESK